MVISIGYSIHLCTSSNVSYFSACVFMWATWHLSSVSSSHLRHMWSLEKPTENSWNQAVESGSPPSQAYLGMHVNTHTHNLHTHTQTKLTTRWGKMWKRDQGSCKDNYEIEALLVYHKKAKYFFRGHLSVHHIYSQFFLFLFLVVSLVSVFILW